MNKNKIKWKTINFAIIGCGKIAQRHAEHINNLGKLTAVCDIKPARSQELAARYNARNYSKITELFKKETNTDVISICTPNGFHAAHAIQALQAGFHVLCEKPMALNTLDCSKMIKASQKANKCLFIVKQNRFNPPVIAVKKAIEQNKLGKILNIHLSCFWNRDQQYYQESDWKGTKNLDGGILFTQFSHFIDLIYWMIGDIKKVYSLTKKFIHQRCIEFEDSGVAALEFYNGALGTINFTINSFSKNMEGSLTIFGEKGTVKIGGEYLNELEYQNIKDYQITGLTTGKPANDYGAYKGSMSNHDEVYQNVIEVLTKGAVIATNGFEGLKTVEIIKKIYQAANH